MNICIISSGSSFRGAQISTLEFIEGMIKEALNINVIACENSDEGFLKALKSLGLPIKEVVCSRRAGLVDMELTSAKEWIKQADIVWITDIEFLVAPKIKKIRDVPVIVHLHSYPFLCPWWGLLHGLREACYRGCGLLRIIKCKQMFNEELSKLGVISPIKSSIYQVFDFIKGPLDYFDWKKAINRIVLDSINGFIAVSNFVKKIHEELLPIKGKPIEMIYNPVTYPLKYIDKFKNLEKNEIAEENLVVYASGSNPVKGPHLLLQAWKMLLDEGHDIKLLMFGCRGTWVERHIARLGVEKNVVCMGRESFDVLYNAMFRAKAVVMPSIWPEPFGRVPVEANRLGTPAVVTNMGGLPETIAQNRTGIVVDPISEKVAEGILKALNIKRGLNIIANSLSIINPEESMKKLIKTFYMFY